MKPLLRLAVAWAVLCVFFYFLGAPLVRALSPVFAAEVEALRSDLRVSELVVERSTISIALKTTARRPQVIRAQTSSGFGFTYPILVVSLLAAWPFASWRKRAGALALASALLLGLVLIDLPVILLLSIEEATSGREPFASFLYYNGGRQFLALVVFVAALRAAARSPSRAVSGAVPTRRPVLRAARSS